MRADGIFIAVEVDDTLARDAEQARKLTEACPVDIFSQAGDGTLEIVSENLDECVLCRLCLDAVDGSAPQPTVSILKLYDDGAVLA